MVPKDAKYEDMRILICELVDGTITSDGRTKLNQILANDPEAVKHYIDFLDIQVLIKSNMSNTEKDFSTSSLYSDDVQELVDLWHQLAKEERSAPEIEIPKEESQHELIQEVVYPPREKRKVSKFGIVFLTLSAAAILSFVLFIKFASPKTGVEVATLTDSINATWANGIDSMDTGARLATGSDNLCLQHGLAELLFDNNTKVVIEGPAEFELPADNQIHLRYGRIYATVPHEAIGFTINTPTSQIIDLGTEFGVRADALGDVYLHVIKGKTTLLTGDRANRVELEVTAGQAKKVSAATLAVSDIPCETALFVRDIDSQRQNPRVEQSEIDLANIIAGNITMGKDSLMYKQGTINQKLWTYFRPEDNPVSLGVGEQLRATVEFTPHGNLYDNSVRGFRFGLFNDPTNDQVLTYINSDSGGGDDPWMDATGYGVQMALSKGPLESTQPSVGKRTDLTHSSLMGSADAWTFTNGGEPIINAIDIRYTLTLKLKRIAEHQMQVTFTIADADGVISTHTIVDDPLGSGQFGTDPIATDFDQLFFRFSSADSTADELEFHRFKIEYVPKSAADNRRAATSR